MSISINYVQTATEGDVVCTTELDRRNRRLAVLRSEVRADDGRLLATAIGSYTIYPAQAAGRAGIGSRHANDRDYGQTASTTRSTGRASRCCA